MIHDNNPGSGTPDYFEQLERLAATDPMTGLANRRGCEKSIAAEISRTERERKPLSVVVLDINHLKDVNETYGYLAGDRVLREISEVLHRAIRPYDILARWGADEFLIVLPDVDLDRAQTIAARIVDSVATYAIQGIRPVTVASGVSTFDSDYDFAETLKAAYRRLNRAKQSGEGDADPHAAVREPRPRGPEGTVGVQRRASTNQNPNGVSMRSGETAGRCPKNVTRHAPRHRPATLLVSRLRDNETTAILAG